MAENLFVSVSTGNFAGGITQLAPWTMAKLFAKLALQKRFAGYTKLT
jgi:hypothetical protein